MELTKALWSLQIAENMITYLFLQQSLISRHKKFSKRVKTAKNIIQSCPMTKIDWLNDLLRLFCFAGEDRSGRDSVRLFKVNHSP